MKYLVVSDTHGQHGMLEKALKEVGEIDGMIHLGDAEGREDYIQALAGVPMDIVAGNNDYFSDLPREVVLTMGKHRVLVTHGHTYRVGMGTMYLTDEAKSRDCDVALFGHTHIPYKSVDNGILVFNPGSISYPRQSGRKPSYGIINVDKEGEIALFQHYID